MLAALLFTVLTFLPMIKIGGISIPSVLFLFPVLLSKKTIIDKKLFKLSFLSSVALAAFHIPILLLNGNLSEKGVIYALFPLIIFLIFSIVHNIIMRSEIKRIAILLKAFLIIQLLLCIVQVTDIFGIRTQLEPVFLNWQSVNALKETEILEISYRPFGTIGSPVYLAIIAFIFGKCTQLITKKQVFYFVAVVLAILSGARLAILMIIIFFIIDHILKLLLKYPVKSIIAVGVLITALIFVVNYVPFFQILFERYIINGEGLLNDYSISYRMSMLDLFGANLDTIFLGGYGIENFPSYVDNELILRVMQLGIFGLLLIMNIYFYIFKSSKDNNNKKIVQQQVSFLLACMLTSVVFTNLFLMQYTILGAAIDKEMSSKRSGE